MKKVLDKPDKMCYTIITKGKEKEIKKMTHGTTFKTAITTASIIGNKNGIVLKEITMISNSKNCYFELYMDNELVNRFYNLKTAKAMFKDFSA